MRVMVTGAAGYIGMPLAQKLKNSGHEVVAIDLGRNATNGMVDVDIRQIGPEFFSGIDAIIHLAGISFAPEWSDTDDVIFDFNVIGTHHLVERAQEAGVRRFVLACSASIFESVAGQEARVETPAFPISAYGKSKIAAEYILRGSNIPERVSLRKGTLCGVGVNPRWDLVLNSMAINAARTGKVFVDGEGNNYRPMLRLSRAVGLYASAATDEMPAGFHCYNVCDDNASVIDLAKEVCRITDAELIHREYTGRPRSYRMANQASVGLKLSGDMPPAGINQLVAEVVDELFQKPELVTTVSEDPRRDRLESIRAWMEEIETQRG